MAGRDRKSVSQRRSAALGTPHCSRTVTLSLCGEASHTLGECPSLAVCGRLFHPARRRLLALGGTVPASRPRGATACAAARAQFVCPGSTLEAIPPDPLTRHPLRRAALLRVATSTRGGAPASSSSLARTRAPLDVLRPPCQREGVSELHGLGARALVSLTTARVPCVTLRLAWVSHAAHSRSAGARSRPAFPFTRTSVCVDAAPRLRASTLVHAIARIIRTAPIQEISHVQDLRVLFLLTTPPLKWRVFTDPRPNYAQLPLASLARCVRCASTSRTLGPVDSTLTGRHRPLCLRYRTSASHPSANAPRCQCACRALLRRAFSCLSDVRMEWVRRRLLSATHEPLLALRTAAACLLVPSPAPRTTTRSSPLHSHRTVRTDDSAPYPRSSFPLPTFPTVRGLAHRPRCPALTMVYGTAAAPPLAYTLADGLSRLSTAARLGPTLIHHCLALATARPPTVHLLRRASATSRTSSILSLALPALAFRLADPGISHPRSKGGAPLSARCELIAALLCLRYRVGGAVFIAPAPRYRPAVLRRCLRYRVGGAVFIAPAPRYRPQMPRAAGVRAGSFSVRAGPFSVRAGPFSAVAREPWGFQEPPRACYARYHEHRGRPPSIGSSVDSTDLKLPGPPDTSHEEPPARPRHNYSEFILARLSLTRAFTPFPRLLCTISRDEPLSHPRLLHTTLVAAIPVAAVSTFASEGAEETLPSVQRAASQRTMLVHHAIAVLTAAELHATTSSA
ncbi:hypothetical protein B0H14DRAFT_3854326 [Mycena olivaceomarginata]|nr:hypothetical protein B0H14DRAFT_3854326 [Mycena olivaceomarginata]